MKLAEWLKAEKVSQADFAVRIGTSQVAVNRYANGLRIPRRRHMQSILQHTAGQVTADDFYSASGLQLVPEAV